MKALTPFVRRLLGALVLGGGVLVVVGTLRERAPREVEVHLSLRSFETAGVHVRAVTVSFERADEPLRVIEHRFGVAPREVVETVSLPEGSLRARVTVTLDDRVLERVGDLGVRPGSPLELAVPTLP